MVSKHNLSVSAVVAAQVAADSAARAHIAYVQRVRNYRQALISAGIISKREPEYGAMTPFWSELTEEQFKYRVLGVRIA